MSYPNFVHLMKTRQGWTLGILVTGEVTRTDDHQYWYTDYFTTREEADDIRKQMLDKFAGKGRLSIPKYVVNPRNRFWGRHCPF